MTEKPYAAVWAAIEGALQKSGDADIQAGLAFVTDETKIAVVNAAVDAVLTSGIIKMEVRGGGGP